MRSNRTLELLRKGAPAYGTWLQLASPPAARLLAAQGLLDWMLLDFEHAPVDFPTASVIFGSISDVSAGRVTPLARVPVGSIDHIKHALDAGAQGIIVPMVRDAEQVATAASYARFPPQGTRGAGSCTAHLGFGISRVQYLQTANEQILFGVQIETREALDDLDRILDVPGIDMCFVGPNDLHMALGYPPRFWSDQPRFVDAVTRIKEGCARRKIPLGTLCRDVPNAKARRDDGFRFLGVGSELHYMLTSCGMQMGELAGIPQPESWCDVVRFDERDPA